MQVGYPYSAAPYAISTIFLNFKNNLSVKTFVNPAAAYSQGKTYLTMMSFW